MILDLDHHIMNNMMDFSPNSWIIFILGGFVFLIIVVVLIYFLSRNTSKAQESHLEPLNSEKIVTSRDIAYFCPNCGEKLEERALNYCPYCGSEIKFI